MSKRRVLVDVIVVGAGPAGAACAASLARRGVRTLVLDARRFPRDKTCGDGLGTRVPAALASLGLSPSLLDERFSTAGGVTLTSPGGDRCSARLPAAEGRGTVVHLAPRRELDLLLRNHAEACGAEIREGVRVTDLARNGRVVHGVVCAPEDGVRETIRAHVVVGADGEESIVRRVLGKPRVVRARTAFAIRAYVEGIAGLEDAIELHYDRSFSPAYAWIFPLGDDRANVGCGLFDLWGRNRGFDLPLALRTFMAEHPAARRRFQSARQSSPLKGWSLSLGSQSGGCVADGVLLIGDAACFINPLTGEGIWYALRSGELAAEVIARAMADGDYSRRRLSAYYYRWRREFRDDFRYGHWLRLLVGRYPQLLDRIARTARSNNDFSAVLAGVVAGSYSPKRLLSPRALLQVMRQPSQG